ncbi:hypothetical protein WMC41_00620 [Shinella yambaruensis]|uniref:hypothetical protein n=1 Tax=Shinella yambaruensis TaxID=415996 RepID=UPI003D79EE7F
MRLVFLTPVIVVTLIGSAAAAEDTIQWGTVAGWNIASDKTLGGSCFMATFFENGIVLRLGFQQRGAQFPAYFALASNDWKSIEVGKEYQLRIQLDNKDPWDAPAVGLNLNGLPALMVSFGEAKFIGEFVRQHAFKATFNGSLIANLSLKGSAVAARELATCQKTIDGILDNGTPSTKRDPFSVNDPAPEKRDPFAL